MELPVREFSDDVTVPDRCRGCVHLQNLERAYSVFAEEYDDIVKMHFEGNINEYMIASGIEMGLPLDQAVKEVLEDPATTHEAVSQATEDMANLRDGTAQLAQKMANHCPGSLRMRAAKAGRQVTVTVCMSDVLEELGSGKPPVEPVRIIRQKI